MNNTPEKEAERQRKESAFRQLAVDPNFQTYYCAPLQAEAKAALRDAIAEAMKPAGTRIDQQVIDKLREYHTKDRAANDVFYFIADLDAKRLKDSEKQS